MKLTDSHYAKAYKKQIEKVFPKDEAARLWKTAERYFRRLVSRNANIPKEVALHTNKNIFPAIAVYKNDDHAGFEKKAYQLKKLSLI